MLKVTNLVICQNFKYVFYSYTLQEVNNKKQIGGGKIEIKDREGVKN